MMVWVMGFCFSPDGQNWNRSAELVLFDVFLILSEKLAQFNASLILSTNLLS